MVMKYSLILMERFMVIVMNKKEFIEELIEKTGRTENECIIINSCIEENFIIGKKNKEKTISLIMEKLDISYEEANNIYNIASSIISKGIKNSIIHPFKSKD